MAGMITPHVAELHELASFGITCVPEIHPAHVVLNIHLFSFSKSYTFGPANPISAPVQYKQFHPRVPWTPLKSNAESYKCGLRIGEGIGVCVGVGVGVGVCESEGDDVSEIDGVGDAEGVTEGVGVGDVEGIGITYGCDNSQQNLLDVSKFVSW